MKAPYLIRFTPRRPKSIWSKVNVKKVERLIAEELMQPSGLKQVACAKADGRWDAAYEGQSTIVVPIEFIDLINKDSEALRFYESMNKANKYSIAFRIAIAVGEDKKTKVKQKILEMLKNNKSFH